MNDGDEKTLNDLIELIQNSSLSEDDKNLWFNAVKDTPSRFWEALIYGLADTPETMNEVTSLLKQKIKAIEAGDEAMWETIIGQEEKELTNYSHLG